MKRTYEQAVVDILRLSGPRPAPVEAFPIDERLIRSASTAIGKDFPVELIEVWHSIGAPFFNRALDGGPECDDQNALLSPDLIPDVYLDEDWDDKSLLPFFDVSDGDYLALDAQGRVRYPYWDDVVIAPSLKQFIVELTEDPLCWKRHEPGLSDRPPASA